MGADILSLRGETVIAFPEYEETPKNEERRRKGKKKAKKKQQRKSKPPADRDLSKADAFIDVLEVFRDDDYNVIQALSSIERRHQVEKERAEEVLRFSTDVEKARWRFDKEREMVETEVVTYTKSLGTDVFFAFTKDFEERRQRLEPEKLGACVAIRGLVLQIPATEVSIDFHVTLYGDRQIVTFDRLNLRGISLMELILCKRVADEAASRMRTRGMTGF